MVGRTNVQVSDIKAIEVDALYEVTFTNTSNGTITLWTESNGSMNGTVMYAKSSLIIMKCKLSAGYIGLVPSEMIGAFKGVVLEIRKGYASIIFG